MVFRGEILVVFAGLLYVFMISFADFGLSGTFIWAELALICVDSIPHAGHLNLSPWPKEGLKE